jgi:hypothetical protein
MGLASCDAVLDFYSLGHLETILKEAKMPAFTRVVRRLPLTNLSFFEIVA